MIPIEKFENKNKLIILNFFFFIYPSRTGCRPDKCLLDWPLLPDGSLFAIDLSSFDCLKLPSACFFWRSFKFFVRTPQWLIVWNVPFLDSCIEEWVCWCLFYLMSFFVFHKFCRIFLPILWCIANFVIW